MWQSSPMDKATWIGLAVGIGGILLGNLLEGGHINSLMQLTALVIVVAGTLGAVMVSHSSEDLQTGFKMAKQAFSDRPTEVQTNIRQIVDLARIAKKESVLDLEKYLNEIKDADLKGIMRGVIDGFDGETLRDIYQTKFDYEEEKSLSAVKVWTDAGGFAPTIGIIGAVLGLIHVMGNLTDTSKLGAGIAVAFVATVYGVASANLVFLPLGNKLKKRVSIQTREKMMLIEGGVMILEGKNPAIIEQKLKSYVGA